MTARDKATKMKNIKIIESHLRNRTAYETAIRNLEKQLDYIMPKMTASYEAREGSVGFTLRSSTEDIALDRIEGRRALAIREEITMNQFILEAIAEALADLDQAGRDFIRYRYDEGLTFAQVAQAMGYSSETSVFTIRNRVFNRLLITLAGVTKL